MFAEDEDMGVSKYAAQISLTPKKGMVRVWFGYGSGMVRGYGSGMVRVWFTYKKTKQGDVRVEFLTFSIDPIFGNTHMKE